VGEYVHVTSPIRRMVDLLNQIILAASEQLVTERSHTANQFLDKWLENINGLNKDMKTIRKVQTDCQLLERCTNNPELLDDIHECVLFGKMEIQEGVYSYVVYLTNMNILTRIKSKEEYTDLSKHICKLFVFSDEDNIKNKIKCELQ